MPRPAPAHDQADPGVQADALRRGVLARRREEQAAPAHLRHRLGEQGGARGAPAPHRGGRAARPPPARSRPRPVQLPRRDRLGPARLPPQGRGDQAGDGGLRPPPAHRGGLRVRRHAAHRQGGPLPHLGPPALLRRGHVPAAGGRRRGLPPQGDELPDAQPDLPVAAAVLPRAAAAAVRVRLGLPPREVRRGARPDPRARLRPGRLALLRHPRAGARRRSSTCSTSAGPASATSASTTSTSSSPPATTRSRTSSSAPTRTGPRPRPSWRRSRPSRASSWCPDPGGAAYYGPKISVQARDAIGRTWQMSTIQYDFNQPSADRFDLEYVAADGSPPAAGDDPLGQVRLDRALHRRPRRALRRRLPALARARAGAGASRSPSGTPTTSTTSRGG